MALIRCKECNKEISSEAEICPNCGYKNNTKMAKENKSNLIRTGSIISLICSSLIIIIMVSLFIISIIPQSDNTHNKSENTIATVEIEMVEGNTLYFKDLKYFFVSLGFVLGCFIIVVLYFAKKIKNIKLYKCLLLGMSIIQFIFGLLSINTLVCCGIIYIIVPVINLVGAIMVAVGKIR